MALLDRAVRAMAEAGFGRPEVVDAADENGQRKVLECETQAIEEEGTYRWL